MKSLKKPKSQSLQFSLLVQQRHTVRVLMNTVACRLSSRPHHPTRSWTLSKDNHLNESTATRRSDKISDLVGRDELSQTRNEFRIVWHGGDALADAGASPLQWTSGSRCLPPTVTNWRSLRNEPLSETLLFLILPLLSSIDSFAFSFPYPISAVISFSSVFSFLPAVFFFLSSGFFVSHFHLYLIVLHFLFFVTSMNGISLQQASHSKESVANGEAGLVIDENKTKLSRLQESIF